MAKPNELQRQADAIRHGLQRTIQGSLAEFTQHMMLVIKTNPTASISELLTRPDVYAQLTSSLVTAQQAAQSAVQQAALLSGSTPSPYQQSIAQDVNDAYSQAPQQIKTAVTRAFHSIPSHEFEVGVDQPGTNPVSQAAHDRAAAVHAAMVSQSASLALRNGLSVDVAGARSHTDATLQDAQQRQDSGEDVWLQWNSRKQPGITCPWCWDLDGQRVKPGEQFQHPQPIGKRKAPKLYQGTLHGCPLHPNCECWITIESSGQQAATEPADTSPQHAYISSVQIAEMSEEKYHGLLSFLHSALHELGQVLSRLLGGAGGS